MKKIFFTCLILMLIPIDAISGTITITSPTGQTEWLLGSQQKIKWIAGGVSGRMKISLWRSDELIGVIADNIMPPPPQVKSVELTHTWRVGDYIGGTAEPGQKYWIKIGEGGTTLLSDEGTEKVSKIDKYFTIKKMANKTFAKQRFWDLELYSIKLNGTSFNAPYFNRSHGTGDRSVIYMLYFSGKYENTLPESIPIEVCIQLKTIPKDEITQEDVSKWGSGEVSFKTEIRIDAPMGLKEVHKTRTSPNFTYEDVKNWSEEGKTFDLHCPVKTSWNPMEYLIKDHLGEKFPVWVHIDYDNEVPETDEYNNNTQRPFIVIWDKEKNMGSYPMEFKSPFGTATKWLLGSQQKIKWIASGVSGRTEISLWRSDQLIGVIADNIVPPPPQVKSTEQTHIWRVGDYVGGKAVPGKNYKLAVKESDTYAPYHYSFNFEIVGFNLNEKFKTKQKPEMKENTEEIKKTTTREK